MNAVEELLIYKQYLELIYYTETILEKFPKSERFAITSTIKNKTYEGMQAIIEAYKEYKREEKFRALNRLDVVLNILSKLFYNFRILVIYLEAG